jgi:hypothetical protein
MMPRAAAQDVAKLGSEMLWFATSNASPIPGMAAPHLSAQTAQIQTYKRWEIGSLTLSPRDSLRHRSSAADHRR